ncbi:MAG: prephenate dehydratase [Bacteroidetes bacterium]|nr:prephenate dehydratase [Bacteroidota bacterium]
MKKIAIQGGYGAFHEIAAKQYFEHEDIEIVPRDTFNELFDSLEKNYADYGITAIENTLAGSILPNYSLLLESNMKIVGEIYLRIKQNLVALPGRQIEDVIEVYSHPMALLQCQQFFKKYPKIKLIDSNDTALSAHEIAEKKLQNAGAIASELAAENYGLEILARSIETNKKNYTRFLILREKNGNNHCEQENVNKSSLHFTIAHKIGGLSKILSTLSFYEINLTKIQSMPIIGREWEYQFYVDVMFDDYDMYQQSITAIKPFTGVLNILGEYQKGKSIIE